MSDSRLERWVEMGWSFDLDRLTRTNDRSDCSRSSKEERLENRGRVDEVHKVLCILVGFGLSCLICSRTR